MSRLFGLMEIRRRTQILSPAQYRTSTLSKVQPANMAAQNFDPELRKLRDQNVRLKRYVDQMHSYDRLTGLLNRTAFIDHSECILQQLDSGKTLSAMIEISVSGMPRIGGGLGRFASDYIISAIANRINQCTGFEFVAGRMDYSNFAFFIPDSNGPLEALAAAKKLVESMAVPIDWIDRKIIIEAKAGVSTSNVADLSAGNLLQNAGFALRQLADSTSPSYSFFNPMLAKVDNRRTSVIAAIKESVENDYLHLQYQPVFEVQTGSLIGFESLMRMQHPQLGLISPAEFIPVAEEGNLISKLGSWALSTACRVALSWPNHLTVAVNISPRQFYDGTLLRDVQKALEQTGFPAYRLEVEITESSLLKDSELVFSQLHALREMGCSIALDDFGTGYSSLSCLWKFQFSKLKIDRSFVQTLSSSRKVEVMLKSIIDLGRSLGMKVTAEGVETPEQAEIIRDLGCTYVQGYHFGRPTNEKDLDALIAQNASDRLRRNT
jgi:EAL domain-containing protein (putative c-di-GMP-specific phosphodiesterase class I)/GGDEF domain-containing protein